MKTHLTDILAPGLVEWQGIETVTTKTGKEKQVLSGIPGQRFWKLWKGMEREEKQLLKIHGLMLRWEISSYQPETATGQPKKSGGRYRYAKAKKLWTVQVWLNKYSRPILAECGFQVYEEPGTIESREPVFASDPF